MKGKDISKSIPFLTADDFKTQEIEISEDEIVRINEQMKNGTIKTYTISEFEAEMDKHRSKKHG